MDPKLRVTLPPDPNPRPPRFKPPPGTCDSHFHVFGPPHLFPYAESRRYTPPAAPVEHFFGMAAVVGIERGVMVQPTVHLWDSASTLEAIARGEGRLRGIVHANPNLTEADHRKLHAGGVRGVRFNCNRHSGGSFDEQRCNRVLAQISALDWQVDLHTDPEFIAEQAEFIRRIPLPVVIDHFGGVRSREGEDQAAFRALHDLLGETHVWLKLSGADRLLARGARYEEIVALAQVLIARAPDRMIWGTDWPHSNVFQHGKIPNDGDLMSMMLDFAPDETVRRRILVDNPARLFGFR
ncbi:MAG: 2-pyrone-4,6-dicarboxylate lactonase [Alphaproteobacteria bacterium]|nr:2-pyrone-4,6-dicarboxylate lactonase [Alphaproteobacteria bacterium]